MDPLSITSAIFGLLTAAGKVYALLELFSAIRNAPAAIRDAQGEVQRAENALYSMQGLLHRLDVSDPRRRSLIQIDELRITLSDAMLAFSAFEAMLQRLASLTRFRAALSWVKFSKQVDEHAARTGRHQQALTLMLNILQCHSDVDAYLSQQKLQSLIEKVLAENAELRHKLSETLESCSPCAVATQHGEDDDATVRQRKNGGDDALTARYLGRTYSMRSIVSHSSNDTGGTFGRGILRFAFENILQQSWVYRKNANQVECDRSYTTSTNYRSHAWTIFSGYTLADISVLSVIAMPLTTLDVANGHHYPIGPQNGSSMEPQGSIDLATTSGTSPSEHGLPEDLQVTEDSGWEEFDAETPQMTPIPQMTSMEIDEFSRDVSAVLGRIRQDEEEGHDTQDRTDQVGADGARKQEQEVVDRILESFVFPLWHQNRKQGRNLMWLPA